MHQFKLSSDAWRPNTGGTVPPDAIETVSCISSHPSTIIAGVVEERVLGAIVLSNDLLTSEELPDRLILTADIVKDGVVPDTVLTYRIPMPDIFITGDQ